MNSQTAPSGDVLHRRSQSFTVSIISPHHHLPNTISDCPALDLTRHDSRPLGILDQFSRIGPLCRPIPPHTMAAQPRHSTMLSVSNTVGTPQSGASDKSQTPQQPSTPQPSQGLRVPSNRKTIYDRHLNRSRNAELSRASFAYLFAEMVTYAQRRVTGIQDLEKRCAPAMSSKNYEQ